MKTLIFTIFALCIIVSAKAQCVADSIKYPGDGLHPDSLPHAKGNVPYDQVIQFRFPTDTNVSISGTQAMVHVDSVSIDSVPNLPKSFAYKCGKANCTYKGGKYGCIELTGNPLNSQAGKYGLKIYYTAYVIVKAFGIGARLDTFGIVNLNIDAGSGIFAGAYKSNAISQNFPNPFNTSTEIQFGSTTNQPVAFKVINELGQQVYCRTLQSMQGTNSFVFERNNLPAGMYFYSIQMGNDIVTRRMVIKD